MKPLCPLYCRQVCLLKSHSRFNEPTAGQKKYNTYIFFKSVVKVILFNVNQTIHSLFYICLYCCFTNNSSNYLIYNLIITIKLDFKVRCFSLLTLNFKVFENYLIRVISSFFFLLLKDSFEDTVIVRIYVGHATHFIIIISVV